MAWVWYENFSTKFKAAEIHPKSPVDPAEVAYGDAGRPIFSAANPVFKVGTSLKNFERFHSPPVLSDPIVDPEWQEIIRRYASEEVVRFHPVRVVCRDGVSEKYSLLLPLMRVICIDVDRSDIVRSIKNKSGLTAIFGCNYYVHRENCMGMYHIARDGQQSSHIVISNELQDELAKTGESSGFFQPGDLPLFRSRKVH